MGNMARFNLCIGLFSILCWYIIRSCSARPSLTGIGIYHTNTGLYSELLHFSCCYLASRLLMSLPLWPIPPPTDSLGCDCDRASSVHLVKVLCCPVRLWGEKQHSQPNNSSNQWMIWTYWLSFSGSSAVEPLTQYRILMLCVSEGEFCFVIMRNERS